MKTFVKGILAGVCISFGGWIYIVCGYKMQPSLNVLGALFFSLGLMLICNFKYYLYTGKICYLFDDKSQIKSRLINLLLGLVGNVLGCLIVGFLFREVFVKNDEMLLLFVDKLVAGKTNKEWYEMLLASVCCGMFVYFAVEGFRVSENHIVKNLFIIIFISAFIISGFEHCVANMFYFFAGGSYTLKTLFMLICCILGNSAGGLIVPLATKYINRDK